MSDLLNEETNEWVKEWGSEWMKEINEWMNEWVSVYLAHGAAALSQQTRSVLPAVNSVDSAELKQWKCGNSSARSQSFSQPLTGTDIDDITARQWPHTDIKQTLKMIDYRSTGSVTSCVCVQLLQTDVQSTCQLRTFRLRWTVRQREFWEIKG